MIKSHAILLPVLFIVLQSGAISCTDKQRVDKGRSIEDSVTQPSENFAAINSSNGNVNFVMAAKMVIPAVVHIKIHFNAS